MNKTPFMSVCQPCHNLLQHIENLYMVQPSAMFQEIGERATGHIGSDQIRIPQVLSILINRQDTRMPKSNESGRLFPKTLVKTLMALGRELFWDNKGCQRNRILMCVMSVKKDCIDASTPERPFYPVHAYVLSNQLINRCSLHTDLSISSTTHCV